MNKHELPSKDGNSFIPTRHFAFWLTSETVCSFNRPIIKRFRQVRLYNSTNREKTRNSDLLLYTNYGENIGVHSPRL
jgi:hypothetical protein